MTGVEQQMAALRQRFLVRCRSDRAGLVAADASGDRAELKRLSHGLSGAGGIFGFPDVSRAASDLEKAVDANAGDPQLRGHLATLIERLDAAEAQLG